MKNFLFYINSRGSKKDIIKRYERLSFNDRAGIREILYLDPRLSYVPILYSFYKDYIWRYSFYELLAALKYRSNRLRKSYESLYSLFDLTKIDKFNIYTVKGCHGICSVIKYSTGYPRIHKIRGIRDLKKYVYAAQKWLDLICTSDYVYRLNLVNEDRGLEKVVMQIIFIGKKL